jgi:hypothetical protein
VHQSCYLVLLLQSKAAHIGSSSGCVIVVCSPIDCIAVLPVTQILWLLSLSQDRL